LAALPTGKRARHRAPAAAGDWRACPAPL